MTDWVVLLIPVVLLPIVLLFVFVGCQVFFPVDDYKEGENTGTTTGEQPDFITVDLEIAAMCDATINGIDIVLSSDISNEQFSVTLTTIPPDGQKISTDGLKITMQDEGVVLCSVNITPAEGEPPVLQPVSHDKKKNELVEPFHLGCENGFELT